MLLTPLFALLLISQVYSVTIGNEVIQRRHVDNCVRGDYILKSHTITEPGLIKEWKAYIDTRNTQTTQSRVKVAFRVYRPLDRTNLYRVRYKLIAETIAQFDKNRRGEERVILQPGNEIPVQRGDTIGFTFLDSNGAIVYHLRGTVMSDIVGENDKRWIPHNGAARNYRTGVEYQHWKVGDIVTFHNEMYASTPQEFRRCEPRQYSVQAIVEPYSERTSSGSSSSNDAAVPQQPSGQRFVFDNEQGEYLLQVLHNARDALVIAHEHMNEHDLVVPHQLLESASSIRDFLESLKPTSPSPASGSSSRTHASTQQHEDEVQDPCPICLDSLSTGGPVQETRCSHRFHRSCLSNWHGINCPMCRQQM